MTDLDGPDVFVERHYDGQIFVRAGKWRMLLADDAQAAKLIELLRDLPAECPQ